MKVVNGKLKLEERDRRVGNFVVTNETNYYKIQDMNTVQSHRIAKTSLIGQAMNVMMRGENEKFLASWINIMTLAYSVVPDVEFLTEVMDAANRCIERHREQFYGPEVSDEEDKKILEEQKKLHEDYEDAKRDAAQSSE